MKTVLLITQQFPPCAHTASKRSGCFAKYLGEFGWRPVILSPLWTPENCAYDPAFVVDMPEGLAHYTIPKWKSGGLDSVADHSGFACFPRLRKDSFIGNGQRAIAEIIPQEKPDILWATGPGASPHLIADWASRKFGIPWVADFRDIVGEVSIYWWRTLIADPLQLFFEKGTLRSAARLVTVSEGLADQLAIWHKKPVTVIHNGFDPVELAPEDQPPPDRFDLVYTGGISTKEHPDFRLILDGLDILIDQAAMDPEKVGLHFYGRGNETKLRPQLEKHRRYPLVHFHEALTRQDCVARQRSAAVLVQNTFPGRKGILSGKIFEYLAARRPILAIPQDGDCIDALLAKTQAGISAGKAKDIATILGKWYGKWENSGNLRSEAPLEKILPYSRKAEAQQLARLMDSISG